MSGRRAWARRGLAAVACVLALWAAPRARAADGEAPVPAYRGYVTDEAGVVGEERAAQLESFLDQLQKKTGVQFAVLTVATTAPEAPEQFKVRVFKAWGIGQKGEDDGVLLLVAMQEHRLVFETGYGMEGTLPDGWQARMLRDLAVPKFREGQPADGITVAVLAAAQRIGAAKGVTLEWNGAALRYDEPPGGSRRQRLPPLVLAFVVFIVISMLLQRVRGFGRGYYGGGPWIGGGWGGGFGGGGGGGSSFGGFGGGGSGGGGGGASW